jgi:hypothetical protein
MAVMTFSLDQFELPLYHAEDEGLWVLGSWITGDISVEKQVCLDALAMAADVSAGRPPFEEWSSENYQVEFTPSVLRIQNLWIPDERGEFPFPLVKEVIEDYWKFLVSIPENPRLIREFHPDRPEWEAHLLLWEETWKRPHPYRGTFF